MLGAERLSLADCLCWGLVLLVRGKTNQERDGLKASPVGMDLEYRFCTDSYG